MLPFTPPTGTSGESRGCAPQPVPVSAQARAILNTPHAFFRSQIRRTNRNLACLGLLLIATAAVVSLLFGNLAYNEICGPFPLTKERLAKLKDRRSQHAAEYYVSVSTTDMEKVGATRTIAGYLIGSDSIPLFLVPLEKEYGTVNWLVVKSASSNPGPVVSGALTRMPTDVFISLMNKRYEVGWSDRSVLPLMLDTQYWPCCSALVIVAIIGIGLSGAICLWAAMSRNSNPALHPFMRTSLLPIARKAEAVQEIENDLCGYKRQQPGPTILLGRDWIFLVGWLRCSLMQTDDLIMAYRGPAWRYVVIMPFSVLMSKCLVIRTRGHRQLALMAGPSELRRIIADIQRMLPWVYTQTTSERDRIWKTFPDRLIAEVDERRPKDPEKGGIINLG